MGATTSAGETTTKNYEKVEAGVYAGRCLQVVELGTHTKTFAKNGVNETKDVNEILIVWELGELMEDGRPFTVSWRGTNSLSEKANLYKMLISWRGKAFTPDELRRFDLGKLINAPCMINVSLTPDRKDPSKQYNNVVSVMPLPKGMQAAELQNETVNFGISDLGTEEFDKLWPYVQKWVLDSHEGKRFMGTQESTAVGQDFTPSTANEDDTIPF